jgi:uncharacterized protein
MIKRFKHLAFVALLFVAACVTVNIYFPAAAIQKAADEIVDDVIGTKEQQKNNKKPDIRSRLLEELEKLSLGPNSAHAQIDVEVSTPAIRSIRETMKATFQQLKPFYDGGSVGENSSGLVEVRDTSGLGLKDKADVTRLVEQMNKTRLALYNEIVKANKLDAGALPQVQKIFGTSWRTKSRTNWWIKNDQGTWEKKS